MTSIIDTRSADAGLKGNITITIDALDSTGDWFDAYIDAVEAESGLTWTDDETQYGIFADSNGNRYEAYIEPDKSDDETWSVRLDACE